MRASWSRLSPFVAGGRRLVAIGVVVAALQVAMFLAIALLVRRVFDTDIPAKDEQQIVLDGAVMLVLYLSTSGLAFLFAGLVGQATKGMVASLRQELLVRLQALPGSWHDEHSSARIHSLVVQDTERIDLMISHLAGVMSPSFVITAALAAVAAALNPVLFAVLVVVVPATVGVGRALGRRLRKRVRRWQDEFESFSSDTHRELRALRLTRAQGAEATEHERRERKLEALSRTGRAVVWAASLYTTVQSAVAAVCGLVVLVIGGVSVARGSMTLGDLLAFYAVTALVLRQLALAVPRVPDVVAGAESLRRLELILDAPERESYVGSRRIEFQGQVALERVTFGYRAEPVLRELDLRVDRGEMVAVLGPTGVGKSSLASLILGLYRPDSGRVLADGVALDELDLPALRRQMGVLLQDPALFSGTVRENLTYGREDVTEAELRTAAERSTAADFIAELPNGYDTQIGDEGVQLSSGQRQRLAVARALLGDRRLLLLDEPTSHLDEAKITALMGALATLPAAPTIILITHDPRVAAYASRVVTLGEGRIVRDERREPSSRLAAVTS